MLSFTVIRTSLFLPLLSLASETKRFMEIILGSFGFFKSVCDIISSAFPNKAIMSIAISKCSSKEKPFPFDFSIALALVIFLK